MNAEKLRRLQTQVRIGGKGTPRRKKKVMHQSAATDDKKLQSSLKKLSVSTIPGIEEVNIIKDDLTVIHFNNPKAQASLSANTFAVTGHGESKKIVEMLPEILPQLGQDTVMQLRMFANTMSGNQAKPSTATGSTLENVAEDDEVPLLVNDFEEVAKMEETKSKDAHQKAELKPKQDAMKNKENTVLNENVKHNADEAKKNTEKNEKKAKKHQNRQSGNGVAKNKTESPNIDGRQPQKQQKNNEKPNKQDVNAAQISTDGAQRKTGILQKDQQKNVTRVSNEQQKEVIKAADALGEFESVSKEIKETDLQVVPQSSEEQKTVEQKSEKIPTTDAHKPMVEHPKAGEIKEIKSPKDTKSDQLSSSESLENKPNLKAHQGSPEKALSQLKDQKSHQKDLKPQQQSKQLVPPPKEIKPQQAPKGASPQPKEANNVNVAETQNTVSQRPKDQIPKGASPQPKDLKPQQPPKETSPQPKDLKPQQPSKGASPQPDVLKPQQQPKGASPQPKDLKPQQAPKVGSPQPKDLKQQHPAKGSPPEATDVKPQHQSKDTSPQSKDLKSQQPPKGASPQPKEMKPQQPPKVASPQPKDLKPQQSPKGSSSQSKDLKTQQLPKGSTPQPTDSKLQQAPVEGSPHPQELKPQQSPKGDSPQATKPKEPKQQPTSQPQDKKSQQEPSKDVTIHQITGEASSQPKELEIQDASKGAPSQPRNVIEKHAPKGASNDLKEPQSPKKQTDLNTNQTSKCTSPEQQQLTGQCTANDNLAQPITTDASQQIQHNVTPTNHKAEEAAKPKESASDVAKSQQKDLEAAYPLPQDVKHEEKSEGKPIIKDVQNVLDIKPIGSIQRQDVTVAMGSSESTENNQNIVIDNAPKEKIDDQAPATVKMGLELPKTEDNKTEIEKPETIDDKKDVGIKTQPPIATSLIEQAAAQVDEVIAAAAKDVTKLPTTEVVPKPMSSEVKSFEHTSNKEEATTKQHLQQNKQSPDKVVSTPMTKPDEAHPKSTNTSTSKPPNQAPQTKPSKQSPQKTNQQTKPVATKPTEKPSNAPKQASASPKAAVSPPKKANVTSPPTTTPPTTPTEVTKSTTPTESSATKIKETKPDNQKKQTTSAQRPNQAKPNTAKPSSSGNKVPPNPTTPTGSKKMSPPTQDNNNKQGKQSTPPKSLDNNAQKTKQATTPKAVAKQTKQGDETKPHQQSSETPPQSAQKTSP